jgi:hypothetical protein
LKRIDSVVHNKPKQPDQYRWRIELLSLKCFLQDKQMVLFCRETWSFSVAKEWQFWSNRM